MMLGGSVRAQAPAKKGPQDYVIVQGHRDIWEFNDRFRIRQDSQRSPLQDHLLPRLLEGGVSVVVMPAGGDNPSHRGYNDARLVGSLQVTDMLLEEIAKTNGRAAVLKSKADIPSKPDPHKVWFFLDFEGGSPIEVDPEIDYHPDRRLALLRTIYRLGVRGMQLTHDGRNQLGSGVHEGRPGSRLSKFGVEVVQEMNRLGMVIGVSHLAPAAIQHVAEITKKPIISTHTNFHPFMTDPRQHSLEELKAIASTGGVIGIRYQGEKSTPYTMLADQIAYLIKTLGAQHAAVGWLGHDVGHPRTGLVPGFGPEYKPTGVEAMTMNQQWSSFIDLLRQKGLNEDQMAMVLGGNLLRVFREVFTI